MGRRVWGGGSMVSPFRVRDTLTGLVTCGNLPRDSDVLE